MNQDRDPLSTLPCGKDFYSSKTDALIEYFSKLPTIFVKDSQGVVAVIGARVSESVARELLVNEMSFNPSYMPSGHRRFFQIKHLGLGVYRVKPRPPGKVGSYIVTEFEQQIYPDTNPQGMYGTRVH